MISQKLTYEELEQKVKKLEKKALGLRKVERDMRFLKTAVESSINAIGISDLEGKLIYVNDACVKMWGYNSKDEILGRFLPEFWEGDVIFKTAKELREKGFASGEDVGKRKDGSLFSVQFTANMFKDQTGNPSFMFGSFLDITERKQVEEALLESEKKYRHLSEGTFEAVVWHDEGKIIEANEQYYKMFEYKPEELVGKDAISLTATPSSVKFMRKQISLGHLGPYEVEGIKKDGTKFPMEIRIKKMQYRGKMARLAAIRDLTQRKQVEEALKQKEKELKNKARNLDEVNSALKVLLKRTEQDKKELEERVVANVKELILPYIQKLEKTNLNNNQITFLKILQSNLDGIVSPFLRQLSSKYMGLTPSEIQVANFVKEGKTTKEIAELSKSSVGAVNFHRNNLRKKLGLRNKKVNLRTYLFSLS